MHVIRKLTQLTTHSSTSNTHTAVHVAAGTTYPGWCAVAAGLLPAPSGCVSPRLPAEAEVV